MEDEKNYIYGNNTTNQFDHINQPLFFPINEPQNNSVNGPQYIIVNQPLYITGNEHQNIPGNEPQNISVNEPQYISINPPIYISENEPLYNPGNQPQNSPVNQINQEHLKNSLDSNEVQKIIEMLKQNPNLFNKFNEEVKRDNINFKEESIFNDSNYIKMASKGLVPKKIFKQIKKSNENIPIKKNNNPNIINVCFEISSGQKFSEKASKSMKFKDLCINFITRLGFKKDIIESKDIIFIFNGTKVDINQNKTLRETGIENNSKILVLDIKGLIGA